ncbi:hypothetical protein FGO68_gene5741 [Halteria grandinella]|uniref:Uncharacterized protein n=1 Tax=Halteria grandinella TaxID=5974 RepID=A0A8J8NQY9_HALGN|nr:hypothetical protein FGO68_gene5741 [Halteria grandinella]
MVNRSIVIPKPAKVPVAKMVIMRVALIVHALKDFHGLEGEISELVASASSLILPVCKDFICLVWPSARPHCLSAEVEISVLSPLSERRSQQLSESKSMQDTETSFFSAETQELSARTVVRAISFIIIALIDLYIYY